MSKTFLNSVDIADLVDHVRCISTIICDECGKEEISEGDEFDSSEWFYEQGWRSKKEKCRCPKCVNSAKKKTSK